MNFKRFSIIVLLVLGVENNADALFRFRTFNHHRVFRRKLRFKKPLRAPIGSYEKDDDLILSTPKKRLNVNKFGNELALQEKKDLYLMEHHNFFMSETAEPAAVTATFERSFKAEDQQIFMSILEEPELLKLVCPVAISSVFQDMLKKRDLYWLKKFVETPHIIFNLKPKDLEDVRTLCIEIIEGDFSEKDKRLMTYIHGVIIEVQTAEKLASMLHVSSEPEL